VDLRGKQRTIPIFLKTYWVEKDLHKREHEEQGMVQDVCIRVARFLQVWHDDKFPATSAGAEEPGVRVITKHAVKAEPAPDDGSGINVSNGDWNCGGRVKSTTDSATDSLGNVSVWHG
jgi:hypothetical protein